VLLLANNPQGGEHLKDILVGQILWVDINQVAKTAVIYAILLFVWFKFPKSQSNLGFYLLFAVTVTISVQLVGVYLVFSSLIIPALASYKYKNSKKKLIIGYLTGAVGYLIGLIGASILDFPSGPVIVLSLVLCAVFFWNYTLLFFKN